MLGRLYIPTCISADIADIRTRIEISYAAQAHIVKGYSVTLSEILPTIQSLSRADKLRLIQLLAADVAWDDGIVFDVADKTVPIWSPHDSLQGAATLLCVLDEDKVG
ncbi:MAG: hypothetical protein ACI9HK_001885 [Pirellulaceae bacterium]|jgi:hypothetical protein